MKFIADSEAFATTFAAGCENTAAIGCAHPFTKTMFIFAPAIRGLECSFHLNLLFSACFSKTDGKDNNENHITKLNFYSAGV
jgi:hypothetical protein